MAQSKSYILLIFIFAQLGQISSNVAIQKWKVVTMVLQTLISYRYQNSKRLRLTSLLTQPHKVASITHYRSIENDKRSHKHIQTNFKLHVFHNYLLILTTNFGDQTLSYYYLNLRTHRSCFTNVSKWVMKSLRISNNDVGIIDITKVCFRYCLSCFFFDLFVYDVLFFILHKYFTTIDSIYFSNNDVWCLCELHLVLLTFWEVYLKKRFMMDNILNIRTLQW